MELVTLNNLIPSHIMKFILWHEDEDSDVEQSDEELQSEDEDEEVEDVVELVHFSKNKNLVSNKSVMQFQPSYSLVSLLKKTGMQVHIQDSPWGKKPKHLQIMYLDESLASIPSEATSHKQLTSMGQLTNIPAQESQL